MFEMHLALTTRWLFNDTSPRNVPVPVQLPLYAKFTTPSHVICTTIWYAVGDDPAMVVMLEITPPTTVKSDAVMVPNGRAWLVVK